MSDIDLVFKKVNILKNLYWFLLFLAVSFGMFFTLITPTIKDYRVKNLDLKDSMTNALNYQKEYEVYLKEVTKLKDENKHTLIALTNKHNEENIINFIGNTLKNMKIVNKKVDDTDANFIKYEYVILSNLSSPGAYYDLIDGLNRSPNLVEIDFPIEFSKDNANIQNSFVFRVYELKNK